MEPILVSFRLSLEVISGSTEAERCGEMEGNNEVENDACDAYNDATAGTAKGREHFFFFF